MDYASNKEQILIYFGKFRRSFVNAKGWYVFLSTAIIALVACIVSGADGFDFGSATGAPQTSFILICACIWIGLFNSITLICKERDIIKHEYRGGMNLSSYISAHMLFQAIISLIEAVLVSAIVFFNYNSQIAEFTTAFDSDLLRFISYVVTIFLTIYAADALGLFLSAIVKNVEQAMTVMPFAILLQFLFSGNMKLEGVLQFLTHFTVSRYGYDALLGLAKSDNSTGLSSLASQEPQTINLILCWLALVVFVGIFSAASVKILKSVEKDTRG